jgi:hypothetical protein
MNEIKELLATWEMDEYNNQAGLKSACDAIKLLVAKVEELETKIQILEGGN